MKIRLTSILKTAIIPVVIILSNIIAIVVFDCFSRNFNAGYWFNPIIIVIAFTVANSLLWPVFRRFLMRFIILTFGIGSMLLNTLIFYISVYFIPGVYFNFYGILEVPTVMAIVTTFMVSITNTNYFNTYLKRILKYASKQKLNVENKHSGVIMLEIDGLSITTLKKAINKNVMPTVENFIKSKSHNLKEWETDLSSQTGASQAGILHGNNENIVAYRWVEKNNGNKIMVSSKLSQSPEIEKRISNGKGLLVDGISISNMFSGDSKFDVLTSSKFKNMYYNKKLSSIFLDSYNFQIIIILFLWDIIVEFKSQIMHRLRNVQPRLRRTLIYATIRAGANVLLREFTTDVLTSEILGCEIDTAYATYMGYDEVAHHSGVEDDDVWGVLKQIDLQIQRVVTSIEMSQRNYELVILSDHGQSNGATFKQRYGITLSNYVRRLLPDDLKVFKNEYNIDHFRDAVIPQNNQLKNIIENIRDDLFDSEGAIQNLKVELQNRKPKIIFENEQFRNLQKRYSNSLEYIRNHESKQQSTKRVKDSELIVLGSGNLGLIYLTQWSERLTYEEIVMLFPELIPGLVRHSGIGFILVNSITNGGMVIGSDGIYYLDSDKTVGENPLKGYGKNAAKHLKRQNSFENMPDILVNSFYDEKNEEVCAFEELIGSHGGLGGNQTKPFILYPSKWGDAGDLVGSESIYKFLKGKIEKSDS